MSGKTPLSERREQLGLTHQQVAATAHMSRAYYTNIECGRRVPSMQIAKQIADALHTTVDDLFFGQPVPKRNEESEQLAR